MTVTDQTTSPIRQRYEQVADHLLSEIRSGALAPGDRLPAERDLAQRFGVGRASVREALGSLQLRGIVETRAGAGSYIAASARESAAAGADPALAGLGIPADAGPAAVFEARFILEPAIARQAAAASARDRDERTRVDAVSTIPVSGMTPGTGPTMAGLPLGSTHAASSVRGAGSPADPVTADLLDLMARSCDPTDAEQRQAWSDADRLFHRQIAVRTGNPVLIAIADHLASVMDQPLWRQLRDDSIAVPGRTELQLAEHRLIAAAIDEGDVEAADQLTVQHLSRSRRYMALDQTE